MRVLLTHHFPWRQSPVGRLVWNWALGLEAAGHEVQLLVVDSEHRFGERLEVHRVVCGDDPNADLTFALPGFTPEQGPPWSEMATADLALYRDRLRRRMDAVVMQFDPQVIHAQHIWLLGQLALETGVPYVLNAWGEELPAAADPRYRDLASIAAENATRILVPDATIAAHVSREFETPPERLLVMPDELNLDDQQASRAALIAAGNKLAEIYQTVLDERFGWRGQN
jgi:hypothetical protein